MTIKSVVNSIRKLDSQVAVTMQEMVMGLVASCTATYGGDDMTPIEILEVQNACTKDAKWKGTSAEAARRSEIKACLIAYPYYFGEACAMFRKQYGELRRTHVLMLARQVPKHESFKSAVTTVVKALKSKAKKGGGRIANLGMGLGIIKNTQTQKGLSKSKLNAFRRELATLCGEYGIKY